ncbi:hypothetical protein SAMN05446935_6117 [Burkholderia sp. YR290]|nr:hypothetical protein SAMN05446935_6117 [Burkholderia sp. YR290]
MFAMVDAGGSAETINQETAYRSCWPLRDGDLVGVTRTSMVYPRYGTQDWFCMMAPTSGRPRYARTIQCAFHVPANAVETSNAR